MDNFFKSIFADVHRQTILWLFSALVTAFLFLCVLALPLVVIYYMDWDPRWFIAPVMAFILILLGGGATAFVVVSITRQRQLDAIFGPLGLRGSNYSLTFRQYHGTLRGREAHIYISRGPSINIQLSTNLRTRLGATTDNLLTGAIAHATQAGSFKVDDPRLSGVTYYPSDPAWAQNLLATQEVKTIYSETLTFQGSIASRQVNIHPGRLYYILYRSNNLFDFKLALSPQQVKVWADHLIRLLDLAEALPAPAVREELSSAMQVIDRINQRKSLITLLALSGIAAVFCLLTAVIVVAFRLGA